MQLKLKSILLSIFFLIFFSLDSIAQSFQQLKTDSVLKLIGKHLKGKDADAIYALTGTNFKKQLTLSDFRMVAQQQLFPLGEIQADSLINFVNNKTAIYKVKFETLTMQLSMSLDEDGKLELFLFKPYKLGPIFKPGPVATSNPLMTLADKNVDSVARTYIQKFNTAGLSIGVLNNGKISLYNYGETIKGNGHLPDANTLFEIGSITKTFTSTILAYYANAGKLKLTDLIAKYLPDSVAANPQLKNITLLNLSNHTSGLPSLPDNFSAQFPYNKLNPYAHYNEALLFAYLKTCKLNTAPGEHYAYSNLGVGLLGVILQRISGEIFEKMVSTLITTPLGMQNTVQHLYPMLAQRFAAVYNDDGQATTPWDFDALASCGSLLSSMNDLLIYAKANMNDDGTGPLAKAFKLTHAVTFQGQPKLGLAWHIIVVDGINYYFHNGGTYGSSSFLAFNKEKKLAVIVLSNASESTDQVGVNIIKKLQ